MILICKYNAAAVAAAAAAKGKDRSEPREERMRRFADKGSTAGYNGVELQQKRTTIPWGRRATRFPS